MIPLQEIATLLSDHIGEELLGEILTAIPYETLEEIGAAVGELIGDAIAKELLSIGR